MRFSNPLAVALALLATVQAGPQAKQLSVSTTKASRCTTSKSQYSTLTYRSTVRNTTGTATYTATEYISYSTSTIHDTLTTTLFVDAATITTTSTNFITVTKTFRPNITITVPTPCGFTPILSEAEFKSRVVTSQVVSNVTGLVYSTKTIRKAPYPDYAWKSTSTLTSTVTPTDFHYRSVTKTVTERPRATTVYDACKPNNIASVDPRGNSFGYALAGPETEIVGIPGQSNATIMTPPNPTTASARDCCNFCFSQPVCYGSYWRKTDKACFIYVPLLGSQNPTCDISATAFYIYPVDNTQVPQYPSISNGNCGQLHPAQDNDIYGHF